MDRLVPDDALLPDVLPSGFELRLDETDGLSAVREPFSQYRQDDPQRDERDIHAREIHRFRDLFFGHVTEIGPFQVHDAFVGPQFPGELAVADVDRVHLHGAVLQHAVGEASGGGADVHADLALQCEAEFVHRLFQLEPAAADIGHLFAPDFDDIVLRDIGARLQLFLAVDINRSGHDEGLGLFPALGVSPLEDGEVQPCLFRLILTHGPRLSRPAP